MSLNLEKGSTVQFTYTDDTGERQSWTGALHSESEKKGYFELTMGEGLRTFRHDRVEGRINVRSLPWEALKPSFASQFMKRGEAFRAIKAARLDWEVHLEPVYLEKDRLQHPDTLGELDTDKLGTRVTRHSAVVRSDNGYPLGIVGRYYVPIQNGEMLKLADEFRARMAREKREILAAKETRAVAAGEIDKGRRVYVVLELPVSSNAIDLSKDSLRFFVLMVTSHDGSSAFHVGLVPIRLACTNQLRLWMLNQPPISWTIRHTKNAGFSIKDLKKAIAQIPEYLEHFISLRNRMAAEEVSVEAFERFLKKLIPIPKDASKRTENTRKRYRDGIREAYADSANRALRGSRWRVINAVAAWEQWSKPVRTVKPENRAAWLLTSLVKGRGTEYLNRAFLLLAPQKDGAWPKL